MSVEEQIRQNFIDFLDSRNIKYQRIIQVWQTVWSDNSTDVSGMYVGEDNCRYLVSSKDR